MRLALGAGRLRLVRLQLVESVLLSLAGGLVGLQLAYWVGEALIRALPYHDAARTLSAAPDLRVGPLHARARGGHGRGLRARARAAREPGRSRARAQERGDGGRRRRRALPPAQGAGGRAGGALAAAADRGRPLHAQPDEPARRSTPASSPSACSRSTSTRRGAARTSRSASPRCGGSRRSSPAEPGVASASAAAVTLMSDSNSSSTVRVDGYESKEGEDMNPDFNYVAPGFFETLGLPLVAGRDLADDRRARGAAGGGRQRGVRQVLLQEREPDRPALRPRPARRGLPDRDRRRGARRQGRVDARGAAALRVRALHPGGERRQPDLLRALERRVRRVRARGCARRSRASTRRCRSPTSRR